MGVFVAVGTGGTFTDLVMFDAASRRVRYTKSLTTHSFFHRARLPKCKTLTASRSVSIGALALSISASLRERLQSPRSPCDRLGYVSAGQVLDDATTSTDLECILRSVNDHVDE
jgi:hypothetical protein